MGKLVVYSVWGFIGFFGVVIVILFLAWMAPLMFAIFRPIVRLFKKSDKE